MADGDISIVFTGFDVDAVFGGVIPTVSDVGTILRARTRSDTTGSEIGTFNDTTRPTGDQVDNYITQAVIEVGLRLPAEVPEAFQAFARYMAALRAAMFVELSYDPDRIGDGSAYDRLKEQFDSGMAALQDALADSGEATTPRIASLDVVSPTLAPYPAEIRELLAPAWPVP